MLLLFLFSCARPDDDPVARSRLSAGGATCVLTERGPRCWGPESLIQPPLLPQGTVELLGNGGSEICGRGVDWGPDCWSTTEQVDIDAPPSVAGFTIAESAEGTACATSGSGDFDCWTIPSRILTGYPTSDDVQLSYVAPVGNTLGCGLSLDQEVICWDGSPSDHSPHVEWAPAGAYVEVAVSSDHACALESGTGVPTCWGFGVGGFGQEVAPAAAGLSQLVVNDGHNCALNSEGYPLCWGNTETLGDVPEIRLVELSGDNEHYCGIDQEDTVHCWGAVDLYGGPPDDLPPIVPHAFEPQ